MTPAEVRSTLIESLQLDLIGPNFVVGNVSEVLPQAPSRWYLTGFIVPLDADANQRADEDSAEEVDEVSDSPGVDDTAAPEPTAAKKKYLPSSIGLSFLVDKDTRRLDVQVSWGDYRAEEKQQDTKTLTDWRRSPRSEQVALNVPDETQQPVEVDVPNSQGLKVALSVRPVRMDTKGLMPDGTRSVSVFVVNRREPDEDVRDHACAFQLLLEVRSEQALVARPNLRSLMSDDPDERVADLQYRDAFEYAVGHAVSAEADMDTSGKCHSVRTCWIPRAEVERVAPAPIAGIELSMDALGQLKDGQEASAKLGNLVTEYRKWINQQLKTAPSTPARRHEVAVELMNRANVAAGRIQTGIELLADSQCFDAFSTANRTMAEAARRRQDVMLGKDPASVKPEWRPFQLAFILMNLSGVADPLHSDRSVVDLLFFPTGGGKTEAYLGLAAFTLVLRRLRNPGISSAGLTVLMRYTLRLLTLDQLSRAATLICALELERMNDVKKLGEWPFEIGLWVGRAATPNRMGAKGDKDRETARAKTIAFKNDDRKAAPIPIEECPWCGTKFKPTSFQLHPNQDFPTDLRVTCANRNCDFSRGKVLPIVGVDEPIYRRLPCFMIATVDKFAAMPWTGDVGAFFGRVDRHDENGFYGPCEPSAGRPLPSGQLLPPDLIIQDELHLISGPLGTMVGLYETALDELCVREVDGKRVAPKIVASTATVRRAEHQIQALFNRGTVDVFPPPGPDRRDSFFAEVHPPTRSNARMYLGIAAQGRSPKLIMLRSYLALMSAAQKAYVRSGRGDDPSNPADAYMTLLGYFNSLRELGGCRRIVEDEVNNRLNGYATRKRVGEAEGVFENRKIAYEVIELTSRVSTDKVADAKRRLALPFSAKEHVDVAIATNMISVGLDIVRLGLMVLFGQPKTSAEYIQATSRVGRDPSKPGLVVTLLNIHKPRDRSHYERFAAYHESFYRSVEATSVTPFSPRAMDRGLAGTMVALARQGHAPMTPPRGAAAILSQRPKLDTLLAAIESRAKEHRSKTLSPAEMETLRQNVRERVTDLLDEWGKIAMDFESNGVAFQYQREIGGAQRLLHEFLDPELKRLHPRHKKFRANRSMRDVEPSVNLWLKTMDGIEVQQDDE
ncbi:DISARM system helicase DrmA [soil metagenome]